MIDEKWQRRFILRAKEYASWSKDPSTHIGAVAVEPLSKREISGGYNGFPRGIGDTKSRLENRETKYKFVVHAEANCIYNATRAGISLEGAHLFVYGLPICSECAKAIIQVGITEVYMPISCVTLDLTRPKEDQDKFHRWMESYETTMLLFEEAGVKVNYVDGI